MTCFFFLFILVILFVVCLLKWNLNKVIKYTLWPSWTINEFLDINVWSGHQVGCKYYSKRRKRKMNESVKVGFEPLASGGEKEKKCGPHAKQLLIFSRTSNLQGPARATKFQIQYVNLPSLVLKIVFGVLLPWYQTFLLPRSKKEKHSKMSVERIPPRSAYEFSPPLKAWPATSCSPRLRHFPTADAEVTYFSRRRLIVLAISLLTFFLIAFSLIAFLFITFLLFAFFLIAFFILYLYPIVRDLSEWSNTWQAANVVLQAEGIGSGSRDGKMRL